MDFHHLVRNVSVDLLLCSVLVRVCVGFTHLSREK